MKTTGDRIEVQTSDFRGCSREASHTIRPAQQPAVAGTGWVGVAAEGEPENPGLQPFARHNGFELCAANPVQHLQRNAAGWIEMRRFVPDNAAF